MDDDYEKRYRCPACETSFSDFKFEEKCGECGDWGEKDEMTYIHGTQVCDSCLEEGVDVESLREEYKENLGLDD